VLEQTPIFNLAFGATKVHQIYQKTLLRDTQTHRVLLVTVQLSFVDRSLERRCCVCRRFVEAIPEKCLLAKKALE